MNFNKKHLLLKFLFFAFVFLFSLETFPHESHIHSIKPKSLIPKKELHGTWNLLFGTRHLSEGVQDEKDFRMSIETYSHYHFNDFLHASINLSLDLKKGRSQLTFREPSDDNKINAKEFAIIFTPTFSPIFSFLELRGGVNNQGYLKAPLLIFEDFSFPGIIEKAKLNYKNINFTFILQQSIPFSDSRNNERIEKESTPIFLTETLEMNSKWRNNFELNTSFSHYAYSNLPSIVAFNSQFLGNSTAGENRGAQFQNDFDGYIFNMNGCYCASPLEISTGFQVMVNPTQTLNVAQRFYLNTKFRVWRGFSLSPGYESYINESDVAPAYYQSSTYGFANRIGSVYTLGLNFDNWGFSLKGKYTDAQIIKLSASNQRARSEFQFILQSKKFTF